MKHILILCMMLGLLLSCSNDNGNSPGSVKVINATIPLDTADESTDDTSSLKDSVTVDTTTAKTNIIVVLPTPTYSNAIDINAEISAAEINSKIGNGMNLGNALEGDKGEGSWGVTLEESYFKMLADSGFTSVRVPVRWTVSTSDEAPYEIDSTLLARVDWIIDNAIKNNLMVIVNQHHYNELYGNHDKYRDQFIAIWNQVSKRYQNYPQNLLFEILNEPRDEISGSVWDALQQEAIDTIRTTNKNRKLVVSGADWGNVEGLKKMKIVNDGNMIATFHYYDPFNFTHQNASWVGDSEKWLGTTWEQSFLEKMDMLADFKAVSEFSKEYNYPIYLLHLLCQHSGHFLKVHP